MPRRTESVPKAMKSDGSSYIIVRKIRAASRSIKGVIMNITVYLGAGEGNNEKIREAVKELGTFIGKRGDTLVFGGSGTGLMGLLADSVLNSGGTVIGVEPVMFIEQNLEHKDLTELIVTKDMAERKAKMIELGDAFIALPGGTGTLEEIAEIMSRVSLKLTDAPCILYDLDGYYRGLRELLGTMISSGLSSEERQKGIFFAAGLAEIEKIL